VKKKIMQTIFRCSNEALDIEIEKTRDSAFGDSLDIHCVVKQPLFWRRWTCPHDAAKKNGARYCLVCSQLVSAAS
jgi:hypothetical protein